MSIHKNIKNNKANVHSADENSTLVTQKLDELVALICSNATDNIIATHLKKTIKQAIKDTETAHEDDKSEFSITLSSPQSNNPLIKKYLQGESISKYVLIVLSVVMIVLGLGMIIMPAPPYFEMYTIFYFNRNDGITVMDLMSVIITLAGVYFLVKGIYKNPSLKKIRGKNYHF